MAGHIETQAIRHTFDLTYRLDGNFSSFFLPKNPTNSFYGRFLVFYISSAGKQNLIS
ncbi:hypothetical protein HMPREF1153_1941 [Selenomonas sp. CM52]|nr:hypothetical protein HMPREF1153_1941 [Selenomonas sp. CM52]